jgi:hypothetical protein
MFCFVKNNLPVLSPNVKLLRGPGIDSKESIPPAYVARARIFKRLWSPGMEGIPPAYVARRAGTISYKPIPTRSLAPMIV